MRTLMHSILGNINQNRINKDNLDHPQQDIPKKLYRIEVL
jgi:hypothetical protein